MEAINRSAIVLKPAQPFLDWLHRVDPTSAQLALDDLSLEPTISYGSKIRLLPYAALYVDKTRDVVESMT